MKGGGNKMNAKSYIDQYMEETMQIVNTVDRNEIEKALRQANPLKTAIQSFKVQAPAYS